MDEMIYGIHAVKALLEKEPHRLLEIFIQKDRHDRRLRSLISEMEAEGLQVQMAKRQWLDNQVNHEVHQGIVAKIRQGRQYQENDLLQLIEKLLADKKDPLLLILDGVTDPHNLGACLRSADAAGVHAVIVPKDHSAPLNATVKKVASGAAETVPLIVVTNLARTLRLLKEHNIWIVGTAGDAEQNLYQWKIQKSMALVMGSEGQGMRRLTRERCDELISIPLAGSVSSLNVSVATGVCLFEVTRQRNLSNH
ncbi:23S rRNA (guanosine(2251)-2'-O)-methyltransferase RlmB [Candidatus Regiella insecticola]|uniref:23S rRNA (guanosine-2'-O-)-methyltransferase RlmB n=1 Tax=Candidatus Regiella insecticola TaxID=138073 RepID=A0A6L2ZRH4_9ENTR|nr:23S rRNA (guanosine(2251)-2'-O)-methyltransferase RlmB [Candidatus Regiella insecticola]GFN46778.1 23S rRNA (guanosine-2'-O-)-methyltransferase RlmB [Candidatus Regiella insecticola]